MMGVVVNGLTENEATPEQELIGSVLADRYRVEALLGAGGMGAVYRAEHVLMRKAVAVKVLHREMTQMPEVVARFEREAVAAARIEHPNVATAKDFGRLADGSFYLVLEFVEGQSLARALRQDGPFAEERALKIARQIVDALGAAHSAGIVHRDLKPDNVMLVERDGQSDLVKVLDFGIAKVKLDTSSEQPLTQMGMVFGTPEYMSPEQAQGFDVDARSDLYTLGIILYEMLSGTSPFRHEDLVAVLARQITMDPSPLPQHVSPGTADLVFRLLKKQPAQRVQTAADARERIDALLSGSQARMVVGEAPRSGVGLQPVLSDVAYVQTAPALPSPVVGFPLRARQWLSRLGFERRIAIGRYTLSLGAAVAMLGLSAVTVTLATVLLLLTRDGGSAASAPPTPSDPDVLALVAKAELGDVSALEALAKTPPDDRSLVEWRALGHGQCRSGDWENGLATYLEGLRAHTQLGRDAQLLADVRQAVERPDVSERAVAIAAGPLGPVGADLLYDVWERGKATNSPASQRARALLDQEPVKSQTSSSLRALTALQAAMKKPKCGDLKRLFSELGSEFDERAVPLLTRLSDRRGCGFLGLNDCYSCLRTGGELTRALENARARSKPSFTVHAAPTPSGSASTQVR